MGSRTHFLLILTVLSQSFPIKFSHLHKSKKHLQKLSLSINPSNPTHLSDPKTLRRIRMPKRVEYRSDNFKIRFCRSVSSPLNSNRYKPTRLPRILKRKIMDLGSHFLHCTRLSFHTKKKQNKTKPKTKQKKQKTTQTKKKKKKKQNKTLV